MSTEFIQFCPVSDVPVGGKKAAKIDGTWVMVCNTKEGLFAVSAICSHQDKPLFNGRIRNCKVTCPVHGARFDLKTGEALDLPATQPIPTYEVRIMGDWVEVKI
ncbi:Rieske (2Fe-2S) protein [Haliea sp. E17]|uniref:Rieske (2Fe-2S) protein n=1 Tax=Haliea sp. E17 TaxID=3401576 RepID=UPI003AABCE0D